MSSYRFHDRAVSDRLQGQPPIIDGLLYAGAYILAGAPKIGKSFLVAQLAYHVSTGQRLWGYEVHQGTVLYLALEDDFQRIQSRMFMIYGVADTASLHFATAANKIGNGLDEQLENFIKEHPNTKLVIIDTMQRIREAGGEAYSYAGDYEIIGKLKRFADRYKAEIDSLKQEISDYKSVHSKLRAAELEREIRSYAGKSAAMRM